jgi:hypothetical protein
MTNVHLEDQACERERVGTGGRHLEPDDGDRWSRPFGFETTLDPTAQSGSDQVERDR